MNSPKLQGKIMKIIKLDVKLKNNLHLSLQMLYCQVCCEPFHQFCLELAERPSEENKENWCCRRCKFCHVCGKKNKNSKVICLLLDISALVSVNLQELYFSCLLQPLLECERCQNCYHASCLGPNYPKQNKKKKSWVGFCLTNTVPSVYCKHSMVGILICWFPSRSV